MRVRRGAGWTVAAVLATVAALTRMGAGGTAQHRGDPAVESRILAETIEAFETRWAEDPGNPVIGAGLIDRHLMMFRLDDDLAHLDRAESIAARLAPLSLDGAGAHARLSAARLARHDFSGAWSSAEAAVGVDERSASALGAMFDAALATGRYQRAEEARVALERHHQGTLSQRVRTARWFDATGDSERAVAMLGDLCDRLAGRAVRRQTVAWCEGLLAGMELGTAGASAARRRFARVLDIQPGYMAGIEGLADLAYAGGDRERALRLYREILSDTHPDLYLRVAEIERALGNDSAARAAESRFLRLATGPDAERLNAHPLAIHLAGDPRTRDEALAVIERDLERRPSVETWEVAAWVRLQRGELDEALAASDASRGWGTATATGDYIRGRILLRLGRVEEGERLVTAASARRAELAHHVLLEIGV
ncbi:MAG: hypothetical protein R3195_20775 [Gemmatimonadota bacterium]|nr:hypothetical protein [Gemmatimonadota bacterium]